MQKQRNNSSIFFDRGCSSCICRCNRNVQKVFGHCNFSLYIS